MRLEQIYANYQLADGGGDKGTAHSYIDIYSEMLDPSKSLLEVGVYFGHSLAMFQQYFDGEVLGLEIDEANISFDVPYVVCDATKDNQVKTALEGRQFDYIIDDGSHKLADQITTLNLLWHYLKPGGIYFIEDIQNLESVETLTRIGLGFRPLRLWFWDLRHKKGRQDDLLLALQKVD